MEFLNNLDRKTAPRIETVLEDFYGFEKGKIVHLYGTVYHETDAWSHFFSYDGDNYVLYGADFLGLDEERSQDKELNSLLNSVISEHEMSERRTRNDEVELVKNNRGRLISQTDSDSYTPILSDRVFLGKITNPDFKV